jgi:predicted DCC family thiol-disulfide oxidoreductase YuxK
MEPVILIYDGECPFCKTYAKYVRLKEAGGLTLINAREAGNSYVQDVKARGFNLDDGMVAIIGGKYYHGEEALHVLAFLSSRSGLFNKMNYHLFSSKKISGFAYPFLRAGRNVALKIKGVKQIHG